jgi:hypothetical protein
VKSSVFISKASEPKKIKKKEPTEGSRNLKLFETRLRWLMLVKKFQSSKKLASACSARLIINELYLTG